MQPRPQAVRQRDRPPFLDPSRLGKLHQGPGQANPPQGWAQERQELKEAAHQSAAIQPRPRQVELAVHALLCGTVGAGNAAARPK